MLMALMLACSSGDVDLGGGLDLASLPECELLQAGVAIDFAGGCALGACTDMTVDEVVVALGEPDRIETAYGDLRYEWAGLHIYFDDDDDDGEVDPGSEAGTLYLDDDFEGADPSGLGVGISMACYVAELGQPDEFAAELVEGSYYVRELEYERVKVRDEEQLQGVCDVITVY